ncbi:MAG: hypothetical protein Q8880_13690 [Bacteroidota bacterium]|nr:hypothetical protein [Bacteroidota bacterium]
MIKRILIAGAFIIALLFSSISYSQDNFKSFNLKGKISNNLDIHMEIKPSSSDISSLDDHLDFNHLPGEIICQYSGFYYYDKYAKKIPIYGALSSNGFIHLTEYNEKNKINGWFRGFIKGDKIIKGVWSSPQGKKYPFYLFDSTKYPEDFDLNVPMDRVGGYERVDNTQDDCTYLTIYAEANGKFFFEIVGWCKPVLKEPPTLSIGMLSEIAFYTDVTRTKADFFYKYENLKIHFEFFEKQVVVTADDAIASYCEGAEGVKMGGTFIKTK